MYTKTNWVNNTTPINDINLNKIEQGIYDNSVNIDTLQTQITAVASGSPAGVYATVTALTEADPDHSKIYVVSANGHWYYYKNNQWTDGGVYQAVEDSDTVNQLVKDVQDLDEKTGITRVRNLSGYIYDEKSYDIYGDKVSNNATICTDIFNISSQSLISSSITILGYIYWNENGIPTRIFNNVTSIDVVNGMKKIAFMFQKSRYTTQEVEQATITNIEIDTFNLKNEITSINNELNGGLQPLQTLKGKCVDNIAYGADGYLYKNTSIVTTDIFTVEDGRVIQTEKPINMAALWDNNNNFSRANVNNRTYTIPNGITRIAFMYSKGSFSEINNQKCAGLYINENGLINKVNDENYTILEVGTGKQFNHFIEAVNYAISINKKALIKIYSGTYNIYNELGGDEFIQSIPNPSNWYNVLPTLLKDTKIEGVGNVVLALNIPDNIFNNYSYQSTRISIINCKGNINIKNITFQCNNCRYAIHDESDNDTSFDNTKHIYENCLCYIGNAIAGIGIGTSSSDYIIKNCYISNANGNSIYLHNWNSNTGVNVNVENTIVDPTNGKGLMLGINGSNIANISLKSSRIKSAKIKSENISVYNSNCFRMFAFGNDINSIEIDDGITNIYPPVIY